MIHSLPSAHGAPAKEGGLGRTLSGGSEGTVAGEGPGVGDVSVAERKGRCRMRVSQPPADPV